MTGTQSAELCRITVIGPGGRVDLSVPVTATVANLMPTLVQHTSEHAADGAPVATGRESGSWVLQRLGGSPLDLDGTPQTLDWLEAEEFYLRPADDPMPELDFDDIADGMATAVSRRQDRWNPRLTRRLFLAVSVAVLATVAEVILRPGSPAMSTVASVVLAVLLIAMAGVAGRRTEDGSLVVVLGVPGCLFAAVAAATAVAGVEPLLDLRSAPLLLGGVGLAASAGLLLVVRSLWSPRVPVEPFGLLVLLGLTAVVGVWLHLRGGFTPIQVAGVLVAVFLGMVVFAPKLALRAARLRGPQLPRTADELQTDLEPEPADQLIARTWLADAALTVVTAASSVVFCVSIAILVTGAGWAPSVLAILGSCSALLRAREHFGGWQRVPLVCAGAFGVATLTMAYARDTVGESRVIVIALLVCLLALSLMAMLRPPPRRLLPIWGHLANVADIVCAVAVLPVLFQLLGLYAWARGLAG